MIEVKYDHKLQFPSIEVPMTKEDSEDPPSVIQQSEVEGIMIPLFRYNNMSITFEQISYMKLTCNRVPMVRLIISDHMNLIKNLDTPGLDNLLYMQILPPFDNAYKKIQLMFYITNSDISDSEVTLDGIYYVPGMFDNKMEAYGLISTYEFFEKISKEYSLGFCSNIEQTNDKRFIYNDNRKLQDILDREVELGGEQKHVLDWWIDLWNNITLVDLYNEYTSIESEDNMQIWVKTAKPDYSQEVAVEPYKRIAAFSNHPLMKMDMMYINEYTPKTSAGSVTDLNFEVYSMSNLELSSTLIQDGDIKNDIFCGYEYGGEVFGEFDYLSQRATREMFLKKINAQNIEVTSTIPILGLFKGGKVDVWWYSINSYFTQNVDSSQIKSNIDLPEDVEELKEGDFTCILDRTVSGQYYIMDIVYEYDSSDGWNIVYTLGREASNIERLNPPSDESMKIATNN